MKYIRSLIRNYILKLVPEIETYSCWTGILLGSRSTFNVANKDSLIRMPKAVPKFHEVNELPSEAEYEVWYPYHTDWEKKTVLYVTEEQFKKMKENL